MPLWLLFPSSVMSCWERSRVFSLCVWRLWPQPASGTVSQDAEIIQRFRDVCFNAENRNQVPSTISFFANKVIPSPSPQNKNPLEPLRIDKLLILKTLRPRITYLLKNVLWGGVHYKSHQPLAEMRMASGNSEVSKKYAGLSVTFSVEIWHNSIK